MVVWANRVGVSEIARPCRPGQVHGVARDPPERVVQPGGGPDVVLQDGHRPRQELAQGAAVPPPGPCWPIPGAWSWWPGLVRESAPAPPGADRGPHHDPGAPTWGGGRHNHPSGRSTAARGPHSRRAQQGTSVRPRPQEAPQEGAVSTGGAGPVTHELGERVGEGEGACHFFCVCGLEVGGDPVGVGGGELGEGLFPVGGELALDETGWGGAFAGGFALVRVALLGAFVAVAGLLATVVQLRPRRRRVVAAVLGRPCAVGRSRTLWRWWRGHLPRQWGRHDAAPRGREALGTA